MATYFGAVEFTQALAELRGVRAKPDNEKVKAAFNFCFQSLKKLA